MGGMISLRLASMYPVRLLSLSLLGVTEGGWQVFPRSWRALKYSIKMWFARSAEERTYMDLKFHYTKDTLQEKVMACNLYTDIIQGTCSLIGMGWHFYSTNLRLSNSGSNE